MQSLVPSPSLNSLVAFTTFFSFVYLSLNKTVPLRIAKIVPLRIGNIETLPDWQNWDLSGLAKLGPFQIGKNKTPPDWQNWEPSGLAKLGPFRVGKIGILPDWQKQDPPDWQNWDRSGLAKLGPFRVGKIGTLSDWDPSGFIKIAFQSFLKFSSNTLPDTISDAIMLLELTRKDVFSFPRPFRIEVKPLI